MGLTLMNTSTTIGHFHPCPLDPEVHRLDPEVHRPDLVPRDYARAPTAEKTV